MKYQVYQTPYFSIISLITLTTINEIIENLQQLQMNRGSWGISTSPGLYAYHIRIVGVKMKVKFPCKMKIQLQSQPITNEVSASQPSMYVFNQDYTLTQRDSGQSCFSLAISLTTNRGAKYIAGITQLYFSQLARAADAIPSSKLVLTLSKCLDPEATIEVIVRQAARIQNPMARNDSRQKKSGIRIMDISQRQSRKQQHSPIISPRRRSAHDLQIGTRSQMPLLQGGNYRFHNSKTRNGQVFQKRSMSRGRDLNHRQKSQIALHQKSFGLALTDRDQPGYDFTEQSSPMKMVSYKESYSKLKQKLRKEQQNAQKEHDKRLNLQTNETAMKIQSLRYQLKCQQLEKNMQDKNSNIKRLQTRVEQLERLLRGEGLSMIKYSRNSQASSSINLYQSQHDLKTSNDTTILTLQNKINLANRELQDLKNKIVKINKFHAEKQTTLLKELQAKKQRIIELEDLRTAQRNSKDPSKSEESLKFKVESQQKIISQLQKEHEQYLKKLAEDSKINRTLQKEIQSMKNKIQQLSKQVHTLQAQKIKLNEQFQSEKNKTSLAEFSAISLKKNIEKLQSEFKQYEKIKQKYHNCLVEIKSLEGELKMEQKSHQNLVRTHQNNIGALQKKYQQEIGNLNRRNQQLQSRNVQQTVKIKELETHLNSTIKNEVDNYRRMNQKLSREVEQYKNNERMSRKQQVNYQSKINQTNSEVEVWKNKFKSLENVHKLETQKYTNEINRLKLSLQKQTLTEMNTKDKCQTLSSELTVTSSKLTIIEDKYNRETKQLQQKLQAQTMKNIRLQDSFNKLEQKNSEIADKERQLISKIQEYDINENQYSNLIKRYEQELSRLKGLVALTEEKLNLKTEEANQLMRQNTQWMEKYNSLFQKSQQLGYELRNVKNELQREEKQKQKIELQLNNTKASVEAKDRVIEKQKSILEQEFKNKTQNREELTKMNMKLENTEKEFERFRNHVYDILIREFTGVDGLDSMASFVIKNRDQTMTLRDSYYIKNGVQLGGKGSRQIIKHYDNIRCVTQPRQIEISKSTKTMGHMKSIKNTPYFQSSPSPLDVLNNNDVINLINEFSKQSKALLNKMIEEYRILEKQFEYAKQSFDTKENKYTSQLSKLQLSIHKLEVQISGITHEKESQDKRNEERIKNLQEKVQKLAQELQKKSDLLEESLFTCNGIKMQRETQKQYFEMKINQNCTQISSLQEKLSSLTEDYEKLSSQNIMMKGEIQQKVQQIHKQKENIQSLQKRKRQLEYQLNITLKLNQQQSSKNKQLLSQVSQLQIQFTTQKEKNGKNLELISQQEKKLTDTKEFVNNLIKQKQTLVKQDISQSNRIIELQSIKMNLQTEIEHLATKLQSKSQELNLEKDNNKKLTNSNKQLEIEVNNLKESHRKITQQIKVKQKQLSLSLQSMRNKQAQYTKQIQSKNKEIKAIYQNNEVKDKIHQQEVANLKKQIFKLEEETIRNLEEEIKMISNVLRNTEKQLESMSKNMEEKHYEINSYKQLQERMNGIREKQEETINKLNDEIREKDEQMYSLSGHLYTLEQKYSQVVKMSKLEKEKMNEDFEYKYEALCEDYETKIDELEKQRDYLKHKLEIANEEQRKNTEKIMNLESQQAKQRLQSKEKLNKMEEERVALVNGLKAQIKKISEQKEALSSEIRKKDLELEKLREADKTSKTYIQRLQVKQRQIEVKLEHLQSQSYTQIQNEKKRQVYLKQYEQSIQNHHWALQREIKKQLQSITKAVMGANDGAQSKKRIIDIIKNVQNRVGRLVGEKVTVNNK